MSRLVGTFETSAEVPILPLSRGMSGHNADIVKPTRLTRRGHSRIKNSAAQRCPARRDVLSYLESVHFLSHKLTDRRTRYAIDTESARLSGDALFSQCSESRLRAKFVCARGAAGNHHHSACEDSRHLHCAAIRGRRVSQERGFYQHSICRFRTMFTRGSLPARSTSAWPSLRRLSFRWTRTCLWCCSVGCTRDVSSYLGPSTSGRFVISRGKRWPCPDWDPHTMSSFPPWRPRRHRPETGCQFRYPSAGGVDAAPC